MMNHSKWVRVSIPCETAAFEAVSHFLFEHGADGVQELEREIIGYFHSDPESLKLKQELALFKRTLKAVGFSAGKPVITEQPYEDWSAGWRDYFYPVHVTERIIIKPPWEVWNDPKKVLIDIMPRMAFGTGHHETTRICLELMEKYIQPGHDVLDIGTGSGILAIAAAKLGASCTAVEIDPDALDNTHENVSLNSVDDQIDILHGSLDVVPNSTFDLILANINRLVLLDMLADMIPFFLSKTRLILSGFLTAEKSAILAKMKAVGLACIEFRKNGEWEGLAARMHDPSFDTD